MLNHPDNRTVFNIVGQDAGAQPASYVPPSPTSILPPTPGVGGNDIRGTEMSRDACDLVIANLPAYQDGELDIDQQRLVENHLTKCPQCAAVMEAIQATDRILEREWQDDAPLPSSLEFTQAVNNIMAALPPVPAHSATVKPRRVHARTRWMRFATGISGFFALFGMLWTSYTVGYYNGRKNLAQLSSTTVSPVMPLPHSFLSVSTASLSSNGPPGTSASIRDLRPRLGN